MTNAKRIFHTEEGIRISSFFGNRINPISKKQEFHRGVDYATGGRKLPQYGLDEGTVLRCGYDGTGAIYAEVEFPKLGYIGQYYHLDRLAVTKGQKVNKNTVIGYTGTTGYSTGIHLHFGWYPIADKNALYFNRRWSNFEEFKFNEEVKTMNTGYYEVEENGLKIKMYFQRNNLRLGAISASKDESDYKALKALKNIDDDRVHYCKVNAGYFEMKDKSIYGQHYGVEVTPQANFLVPNQSAYEVVFLRKDSDLLEITNSKDFYETNKTLEFALSPYSIIYHDGKYINKISKGLGNKERISNPQTFLIQLKSKQCILGCVENKCYPADVAHWAKSKFGDDLMHLSLWDSGGSSQMIVNGIYKLGYFRDIPNCLTFYEVKKPISFVEDTKPAETPKEKPNTEVEELKKEVSKLTEENTKLKDTINKIKEVLSI